MSKSSVLKMEQSVDEPERLSPNISQNMNESKKLSAINTSSPVSDIKPLISESSDQRKLSHKFVQEVKPIINSSYTKPHSDHSAVQNHHHQITLPSHDGKSNGVIRK